MDCFHWKYFQFKIFNRVTIEQQYFSCFLAKAKKTLKIKLLTRTFNVDASQHILSSRIFGQKNVSNQQLMKNGEQRMSTAEQRLINTNNLL